MCTSWRAAALALPMLTLLWPAGVAAQTSGPTPVAASQPASRATLPSSLPAIAPTASRPAPPRPAASRSGPTTGPTSGPAADPQAETLAKAKQLFALERYGEARALYQLALAEQPQRHGLLLRIAGYCGWSSATVMTRATTT
jgi:hypothetical protein